MKKKTIMGLGAVVISTLALVGVGTGIRLITQNEDKAEESQ